MQYAQLQAAPQRPARHAARGYDLVTGTPALIRSEEMVVLGQSEHALVRSRANRTRWNPSAHTSLRQPVSRAGPYDTS